MADEIPISGLPAITTATLSDLTTDVQSGVTYKVTNQQLLDLLINYLQSNGSYQSLNITAGGTFQLTNPLHSIIVVTGGNVVSPQIRLPVVNATNSPKPGMTSTIVIFNNTGSCTLRDSAGNLLYTAGNQTGAVVCPYLESTTPSPSGTWIVGTPLQATSNLIELTNIVQARLNLGLGTAAIKDTSNTDYPTVAGVTGSISGGLAKFTADFDGSIQDSGVTANQVMLTVNNLSDVDQPFSASSNINAMKNNGYSQPDLTSGTLILTNPAPTWINTANNDGVSGIQLPPPVDVDGDLAWQPGQIVTINNIGGANGVPLLDSDGNPIETLLATSVYELAIKNTAGNIDIIKLV